MPDTPVIAERFERERQLGLENEGREPVNAIVRHEYARDRAEQRLHALSVAEAKCRIAIRDALLELQCAAYCSAEDIVRAIECSSDTVADMTYDKRCEIENEIVEIDDAVAEAEEIDLRRSTPVRL